MCDLLYGERRGEANSKSTLQLLGQQQKDALEYLTRLAVWLQDYVPEAVVVEQQARDRRRHARQEIVMLWKNAIQDQQCRQSVRSSDSSLRSPRFGHTSSSPCILTDSPSRMSPTTDMSDSPKTPGGSRWIAAPDGGSPSLMPLLLLPPIMEPRNEHGASDELPYPTHLKEREVLSASSLDLAVSGLSIRPSTASTSESETAVVSGSLPSMAGLRSQGIAPAQIIAPSLPA